MDPVLLYSDIADETTTKIQEFKTWQIGYGKNLENGKKFISFALHLFYGTTGELKTGYFNRDLLKPKKPGLKRGYRTSCENNISPELFKTSNYEGSLSKGELNQSYKNEDAKLNNPQPDTYLENWYLIGKGNSVIKNEGNDAKVGKSGLKAAILAVIECFVPDRFKSDKKYDYNKFKRLLVSNNIIMDNETFKVEDVIKNWSVKRIDSKFKETDLKTKLNILISNISDIPNAEASKKSLNDIDTCINNVLDSNNNFLTDIQTNLKTFKNYVSGLQPQTLQETIKDSNPNSLYNTMLINNDELRLKIYVLQDSIKTYIKNPFSGDTFDDIRKSLLQNQINVLLKALEDNTYSSFLDSLPYNLKSDNNDKLVFKNMKSAEIKDYYGNKDILTKLTPVENVRLIGYLTAVRLKEKYENKDDIDKYIIDFFTKANSIINEKSYNISDFVKLTQDDAKKRKGGTYINIYTVIEKITNYSNELT